MDLRRQMHDPLCPACRVLWEHRADVDMREHELALSSLPCAAVVDCSFWTRSAAAGQPQSGIVAGRREACGIKGGGQGLDAAQDQQAGSNVRDEASVFRWKI